MDPHYNGEDDGAQAHPYLHNPLLYISNLPAFVTDENLAMALITCGPFRPRIIREPGANVVSGTIEFRFLEKAEKALATLQSRPIPGVQGAISLVLSPYPPTDPPTPLPPPSALPRLIKHLPSGYTDSQLYDIFRPFGPLASVRAQTPFAPDTGMVEFWNEEDARAAEEQMHCADIEGQNIAVQVYQQRRTASGLSEFNVAAPTFVPSGYNPYHAQQYSPPTPPHRVSYSPRSPTAPIPFIHGPGQQVQLAPIAGPGANSHSGLIDPCNLFCKNLDSDIDSNALFSHFRQFGQIVSARVMRNENGESRGFGFVSYQAPDQAAAALHAMNNVQLGTKQIIVRLHEPRQLRQEKLAQRFSGHNGHPRSSSGATSPTLSEGGDSMGGWTSPRQRSVNLGSPGHHTEKDRGRRGSGSYYNAALAGTLNFSMRYDDLAGLSPVVRKEVLTGDLSRRVKDMGSVDAPELDSVVDALVGLSLSEVVQCIEDPIKLSDKVEYLKTHLNLASPPKSRSPSAPPSRDSSSDANNAATASAPEYPSTPISGNGSLSTPPRTSSPSGSVPPTSERDRMVAAVKKLESTRQEELTDLLMSLPKRERAMCLFNVEVLRTKLEEAKIILESDDDGEAPAAVPVTPQTKRTTSKVQDSPVTPDLSSRGPSAAASPAPSTPVGPTHTIASLAKLPAAEIIRIASNSSVGFPVARADPLVVQATDEFVDGLLSRPSQMQKQQLGEKLFKVVKSFGIKGAPKITVALLDQEDLRALAHLMNSYPAILKDKAQAFAKS